MSTSIAGAHPQTGNTLRPMMSVPCGDRARAVAPHHTPGHPLTHEELAYARDQRTRGLPLRLRSPVKTTSTTPTALDGPHDCADSFDSIHLSSVWPSPGAHCGASAQNRLPSLTQLPNWCVHAMAWSRVTMLRKATACSVLCLFCPAAGRHLLPATAMPAASAASHPKTA